MKDETIIKFGFATLIAGIIAVYFGFWLWGETHTNTFHLKLGDDMIELIKWTIGALFGMSAASGVTATIVAIRKNGTTAVVTGEEEQE